MSVKGQAFNYITDKAQLAAGLHRLKASSELALDTETGIRPEWRNKVSESPTNPIQPRLCPHLGHICLLTLTPVKGKPEVFDFVWLRHNKVDLTPIYELLEQKTLIAHKAQFDGKMLLGEFKKNTLRWWCTLQADKVLSNATGSKYGSIRGHSLYSCLRDYLGISLKGKGSIQTQDWDLDIEKRTLDNPYWLEMLNYAAADTKYLHQLKDKLERWICNPLPSDWMNRHSTPDEDCGFGMARTMELENNIINIYIEMEYYGFPASTYLIQEFQQGIEIEMYDLACDLCDLLGIDLPPQDLDSDYIKPYAKTLKVFNNPTKVVELLNEHKIITDDAQKLTLTRVLSLIDEVYKQQTAEEGGEQSISYLNEEEESRYKLIEEYELSDLVQGSKILNTLLQYKRAVKQHGMSMLRFVNPATNNIHPDVAGPVSTGRMAMRKPNLQQVSNSSKIFIELEVTDGSIQHYSGSALI